MTRLPPVRLGLRGRVIDPQRRTIANAQVVLVSAPAAAGTLSMDKRTATTDGDGEFTFDHQVAGRYMLEAEAGDSVSPTVPFLLANEADYVTLIVFPAATITVTVVSALDGKPISGALVRVAIGNHDFGGNDAYRETHTGPDGNARLHGLAGTANHPVYAEADGYLGAMVNVMAGRNPERDKWTAKVVLHPGPARIHGRVLDPNHLPVANAKVGWGIYKDLGELNGLIDPMPSPSVEGARFTDENGEFTLPAQPGIGCVVAIHSGYRIGTKCNIHAQARRDVNGIEIVLDGGSSFSGRVVDTNGAPVANASVLLTTSGWNHMPMFSHGYRFQTISALDGSFAFSGVDPMPLVVYAYTDAASSRLVPVDLSTSNPSNVRVMLEYDGQITGSVVEEDGRTPVPSVEVQFFAAPAFKLDKANQPVIPDTFSMTRSIGAVLTDENGHFSITSLPPSEYTVHATRSGAAPVPPSYSTVWKYHVKLGDSLSFIMPGQGSVSGRVVYDDGTPVRAFGVSFAAYQKRYTSDSFAPAHQVLSADGSFRIAGLPARHYGVEIHGANVLPFRVSDVEVQPNDNVDLGTLHVQHAVTCSGVVVTSGGHTPVPNAQVLVSTGLVEELPRKIQADTNGHFEIPGLPSDQSFRLRAEADVRSSGWVTVAAGDNNIELAVTDVPTGAVSGVVVDSVHPAQPRLVVLTLVEPGVPGVSLRIEASATAGAGGLFHMDDVRVGTYTIWVRGTGTELAWVKNANPVSVTPQGTTTVMVNAGGAQ